MKVLKALLSLFISIGVTVALNQPWGSVPALGRLLSPFEGFWQNAETVGQSSEQKISVKGAREEVTILFDDLHVPHIFAKNDFDAYFAQGYATARDRLWQMEFQTHAAAGRISELIGDRAVELDRYNRRLGMAYGAEKSLEGMSNDPVSKSVLDAYTAGINAYIDQLKPADYPIEYKLLGYAPEPWTPIKVAFLLKQMTQTLAAGADDLMMTNVRQQLGPALTANLFPDYPFKEDPIIPVGTRWDFTPVKLPAPPPNIETDSSVVLNWQPHDPGIGSNNWAVGPEKTAMGYPILANDPHLTLSLPSIWYQVQLVTPTMNVYGVSLPGAPGVIIGFNKDVAWGVTNVGADVLDFYKIRFRDNRRQEYWHDGKWKPVRRRIETIRVKGKPAVVDTILYTHHGPVVYLPEDKPFRNNIPTGYAARWIAHEVDNGIKTFYLLNRAKTYDDYVTALSYYVAPAQNFVFANAAKDIAISPNGRFPLKWRDQGKFLLDGTKAANDWQGWIPAAQNPRVKNPPRGFVSSANQSSTDPTYPYYINWEFETTDRGMRINQRLTEMQNVTVDSLRHLQNDVYNHQASKFLPVLLPYIQEKDLSDPQKQALKTVRQWNYQQDTASVAGTIFVDWISRLEDGIWADDFPDDANRPLRYPNTDRTLQLVTEEPTSRWFDNVQTPNRQETIQEVVTNSFRATVDSLVKQHGPLGKTWAWADHKGTSVRHLIPGLDAFSALNVQIGGGRGIVNAAGRRAGPSWRMIVQTGPNVRAYGVFPGGQSGNPGSPYYLNMLETWRKGDLYELLYLKSVTEKSPRIQSTLQLTR
ncbi:penicillin acylase family protein [Larkinella punicea]|uniref:Penicillin acylase family protein n=1 Tax=Larkinella punicea TaxID=2315727 RepID=A0A368JNM1_9BACT|nr:penicillin acylase family protein [Larkinella punicea]RCR69270.1 penicillin acylase family protein [Larkinella punicea]